MVLVSLTKDELQQIYRAVKAATGYHMSQDIADSAKRMAKRTPYSMLTLELMDASTLLRNILGDHAS